MSSEPTETAPKTQAQESSVDVAKIVTGLSVFLLFSAFPILVGVSHYMKMTAEENGLVDEASEDKFWTVVEPPALGKKYNTKNLTSEELKEELNDFYFLDGPTDLKVELLKPKSEVEAKPESEEYYFDLDRSFSFLVLRVLEEQTRMANTVAQCIEKGNLDDPILKLRLVAVADSYGALAQPLQKYTKKFLKDDKTEKLTFRRAYVLNRLSSHPVARALMEAFYPSLIVSPVKREDSKIETYLSHYERCKKQVPREVHAILAQYTCMNRLKDTKEFDPDDQILLYNPDATIAILMEVLKEDRMALGVDQEDEQIGRLIEILKLLPEGPLIEHWVRLLERYPKKIDVDQINRLLLIATNYSHLGLYTAAYDIRMDRINRSLMKESIDPMPCKPFPSLQPPDIERDGNNLKHYEKSFDLPFQPEQEMMTAKDLLGDESKSNATALEHIRQFLFVASRFTIERSYSLSYTVILSSAFFIPGAHPDSGEYRKSDHYRYTPSLWELAIKRVNKRSFIKEDDFSFVPSANVDPRTMLLLSVFHRQTILYENASFLPLLSSFLYKMPLDLKHYNNILNPKNNEDALFDIPMELYDGTEVGIGASVPDIFVKTPLGVKMTLDALRISLEQRLSLGVQLYKEWLRFNMVDTSQDNEIWYSICVQHYMKYAYPNVELDAEKYKGYIVSGQKNTVIKRKESLEKIEKFSRVRSN